MNKRISLLFAVLIFVVTSCGDGGVAVDDTTADGGDVLAATTAAPNRNESTTSTSTAPSTTTVAPTTTEAPATTNTAPPPESPEAEALQSAFLRSAELTSGRMEGSIEMTGLDPSQGIADLVIPFGGAFDNASGDFSFHMDMSGMAATAGDEIPLEFADLLGVMEVRQVGDVAYVKFPFFTMFLGAKTPWISMPAGENDLTGGFSTASPGNPSEILGSFQDAGAAIELIGSEMVNGVSATHYRAVFDTEALLAQAPPEERAQLEVQGVFPIEAMPMDVWISDDGLVVRFIMEIDGGGIAAEPGEGFERMLMRYDMIDLNASVVIDPPPL
ncbi:MAG: hypothetical protein U9N84_12115, partial [Actinomycetota bacterium]|nr:hypothetical protein [Actinomycetota bacterium]